MVRFRGAAALAVLATLTMSALILASPGAAWAESGADLFSDNCAICHSPEPGVNKLGPSLAGVVGRPAGSLADYPYSNGLQKAGLTWTKLMLDRWITDPQTIVKGTKMLFAGLKDAQERKAIIDYLATLKN